MAFYGFVKKRQGKDATREKAHGWLTRDPALDRATIFQQSAHALEILVVVTTAFWGAATCWHVLTIGSEQ